MNLISFSKINYKNLIRVIKHRQVLIPSPTSQEILKTHVHSEKASNLKKRSILIIGSIETLCNRHSSLKYTHSMKVFLRILLNNKEN